MKIESYLHVSNSGATLMLSDESEYGPVLTVSIGAFGSLNSSIDISTDIKSLEKLMESIKLFIDNSKKDKDYRYIHNAHYHSTKINGTEVFNSSRNYSTEVHETTSTVASLKSSL